MGSVGQCVRTGWGWEIKFIYSLEYRVALKSIKVMHCWPTAESLGTKIYIASQWSQKDPSESSGCS